MKKRLPLLILLILVPTSCSRDRGLDLTKPQVKTEDSTNIVKVLNRVKCQESIQGDCSQNKINAIWQLCLDNGYVTDIHLVKVLSSREITELVSGSTTVVETIVTPVERIDKYGVVLIENQEKNEPVIRSANGYCIGSEYITQ